MFFMSNPITFDTASPRFGLPLLFAGQSQKEVYVNEAHAITDALLHCAVEGVAVTPPASPVDGTNWLIGDGASGEWSGKSGALACRQAGGWIYILPRDGMQALDRSTGQLRRYAGGWKAAAAVMAASGGSVVDAEARGAIAQVIAALKTVGILAA